MCHCHYHYSYALLLKVRQIVHSFLFGSENVSAPCSAGNYMTETGCQQCGVNTFSEDGASSCTDCPERKIAAAGSISQNDCHFGEY